ncbi:MAG: hypothetical protein HS104_03155 [Polyangiaceae bacterium]|nr:hypothetical protein [Polyangiaceae bacterium]MCL4756677.1 hypothetical protein [Myxococcales bacterium]
MDTPERVYVEFKGESDRAVALLAAAFLDHELECLLRRFFREVRVADSLFKPMQPLSSFSARTKLSYVLALIDVRSYRDLNRIRKIRNVFAHDRHPRAFADPEISSLCAALEWPAVLPNHAREAQTPRARFETAAFGMLGAISTLQDQAHSQKRVALDEQDFAPDREFSHREVDLCTSIYEGRGPKSAQLTITYATPSPIVINWDRVEPVRELMRQLRIVEAALSTPAAQE